MRSRHELEIQELDSLLLLRYGDSSGVVPCVFKVVGVPEVITTCEHCGARRGWYDEHAQIAESHALWCFVPRREEMEARPWWKKIIDRIWLGMKP